MEGECHAEGGIAKSPFPIQVSLVLGGDGCTVHMCSVPRARRAWAGAGRSGRRQCRARPRPAASQASQSPESWWLVGWLADKHLGPVVGGSVTDNGLRSTGDMQMGPAVRPLWQCVVGETADTGGWISNPMIKLFAIDR